jgi:malate permease and related proteins
MFLFFVTLLQKLLPLYAYIFMGFILANVFSSFREILARLMFYGIAPVVIFTGVMRTHLDSSILSIPVVIFLLSSTLCLVFYKLGKPFLKDSSSNLLALCAGSANTGYFGLPIAVLLFEQQTVGIYILATMGTISFESSLGFYITARGNFSPKDCLLKVISLPTLHALLLALILNSLQITLPDSYEFFSPFVMKAFTVVGMMIIGMGLKGVSLRNLDFRFISMAFLAKFVAWPLGAFSLIYLDTAFLGLYPASLHKAFILFSIVPLASNPVVIATILNTYPEKAATSTFLSTLFALFYIPIMTAVFIR